MLITPSRSNLNKIVILNPKGGCGKTTLSTNLAAYYAARGPAPAIMDCDPQGSTMAWIERRAVSLPTIHGIAAYKRTMQATRSWQLRVPNETTNLIVDSPASLTSDDLREVTRDSSSILVPVLPPLSIFTQHHDVLLICCWSPRSTDAIENWRWWPTALARTRRVSRN